MPNNWLRFNGWSDLQDFSTLANWLLYDYKFSCLTQAQQRDVVFILTLACQSGGILPEDPAWVAKRIGTQDPDFSLEPFVACGFMEKVENGEAEKITKEARFSRQVPVRQAVPGKVTKAPNGERGGIIGGSKGQVFQGTGTQQQLPRSETEIQIQSSEPNGATPSSGKALIRSRVQDRHAELVPAALQALQEEADQLRGVEAMREYWSAVVFAYWGALTFHPNARADKARLNRISARLKQVGDNPSVLLYAVKGATRDDFLMGRDPRAPGKKYDQVETIFRDLAQVERLAELGGWKPGLVHPIATKYGPQAEGADEKQPAD